MQAQGATQTQGVATSSGAVREDSDQARAGPQLGDQSEQDGRNPKRAVTELPGDDSPRPAAKARVETTPSKVWKTTNWEYRDGRMRPLTDEPQQPRERSRSPAVDRAANEDQSEQDGQPGGDLPLVQTSDR